MALSDHAKGYLITLTGIARFTVVEELSQPTLFRQCRVSADLFADDFEPRSEDKVDRDAVLKAFRAYLGAHNLEADWESVYRATNEMLVNAMLGDAAFQAGKDCRLVEISATFYDPDAQPGDLTKTDTILLSMMHRALFQKLEGQYYQFKHGYLESQIWTQRRDWARGILELPLGRAWWEQEVLGGIFSREFVSVISDAAAPSVKVKLAGFEG